MSEKSEKEKKPIYKKWWFWVIIVVVIVAISCSSGSINSTNSTSVSAEKNAASTEVNTSVASSTTTTPTETIEYTAITVDELETALENNAAAAKDTYNNKYLAITGRLGTIDSDLKYISLLSATNEWDITGISCTIKNNDQKEIVKTLSKDQTITVKGKITNVGEVLGYSLDITEIVK